MITTTYSLVEICKIRSGKRLPKGCDFSEAPTAYKYIRARDIKNGAIDGSDLVYISEEVQSKIKKYIVNTNDIVITIVGASVGDVAYVASEFDGMNLTENAVRLTEFAPYVNSKYLMYILNSLEYWELMQQIAGGAAQPKLGIYKIEAIKVHLPPKEVQDRIVDMLCTYDDLIENNQKQIKLLEEAAQRLYKEWFVDLRFPGHETTPITDGIPEGWKEGIIQDVVVYHDKKRKPLSGIQRAEMQGQYRYYGAASILDYVNDYLFDGTYLLLGEDGTVVTEDGFPILQYVTGKFWVNNHAHVLTGQPDYPTEYLYMMFKATKVKDVVTGAAQPKISQARLSNKKMIVPCKELVRAYCDQVNPIFKQILNLEQQIILHKEARDRLLPKLMNGEIEV